MMHLKSLKRVSWFGWVGVACGVAGLVAYGMVKSSADMLALNHPLVTAIKQANDAELKATSTYDPTDLPKTMTGERLKRSLSRFQALKKEGVYEVKFVLKQQFQSFQVSPDGQRAEVKVSGRWAGMGYSTKTHACVYRILSRRVLQTLSLVWQENAWLVSDAVCDPAIEATQPCS